MSTARNQIRSTKSFIWYLKDVLGNGATSTVYLGRFKKNGDKVAVKVFNNISFMRPSTVQQREFDVLLKLKHENIVSLIAIEEDQVQKQPVLVMELCTGGSLYSMLEEPEHSYGLKETEFLKVLGDVSAGMQHLREMDIIHRDIKPGNIMRVRAEDGIFTYKLADFGAARELQEDQPYASLYGTEEYLHPDLYQRAVLRQPTNQMFTARTDLWSTGVTIYHVATGVLPFRPYGGRKNRDIMHHITTKKESGVISAVQKESPGGAIEWSKELPRHCHLSYGLKLIITSMLAGLMECDPSKMWTFDRFFSCVQRILDLVIIHLFEPGSSELYRIYVEKNWKFAEFQEQVTTQTCIQDIHQVFYFENEQFHPDQNLLCRDYPETTEENPFICMDRTGAKTQIAPISQPIARKTATHYSLENDVALAKMYTAVLHFGQEVQRTTIIKQHLFSKTAKTLRSVIKTNFCNLRRMVLEIKLELTALEESRNSMMTKILACLQLYMSEINDSVISNSHSHLQQIKSSFEESMKGLPEFRSRFMSIQETMTNLEDPMLKSDELAKSWETKTKNCKPCTICCGKFEVLVSDAMAIYSQFRKDRQAKQLSYNEEQIHKMDKDKLGTKCGLASSMFQSHCEDKWKKMHGLFEEWYNNANVYFFQINEVESGLHSLKAQIHELQATLKKLSSNIDDETESHRDLMKDYFHRLITSTRRYPDVSPNFTNMPMDMAEGTRSFVTQETEPHQTSDSMHTFSEESPSDSDTIRESIKVLPILLGQDSIPNGIVRVPKRFKNFLTQIEQAIQNGTREVDTTKKILLEFEQFSRRESNIKEVVIAKE